LRYYPYWLVLFNIFFLLALILPSNTPLFAQNAPLLPDSLATTNDTLPRSTQSGLPIADNGIDSPIKYSASDSIVYDVKNKKIYLYNNATLQQQPMALSASRIVINQEKQIVNATYSADTMGRAIGKPFFTEGEHQFQADTITYNLKSRKGKIKHLVTKDEDNGGFLQGEQVKKNEKDEMFIKNAFYTTCGLEHPHFKIELNKVKMIPNSLIVSGPAQLVIEDVPTPIILPFGIFPIQKGQRSGVLIPSYGYSPTRGYYFQGGGYYFGFSDFADLAITGDIYTNLTWRINTSSAYTKRYKYRGLVQFDYSRINEGDKLSPSFVSTKNFLVSWNHTQDQKATRNGTFNADVRFGNKSVNREFGLSNNTVLTNTLASSINYRRGFAGTPFNLSIGARMDQNTNTGLVNLTLPELNLNMSRINPFKRKIVIGQQRWYEKIGFTYNLDAKMRATLPDSILFGGGAWGENAVQQGVKHAATLNTDFRLLKYFNFQPSINYSETWTWKTTQKEWIPYETYNDTIINGEATIDTIAPHIETTLIKGFKRAMQFNAGISMTTKLYGLLQFKRGKLKAIRHEMTPSIGFNYRPDFGAPPFDYYKTVQNSITGTTTEYSIFESDIYGTPPNGAAASLNFSLQNNLQMKVRAKKDTADRKVSLLDRLSLNASYNFLDTKGLNWSRVTMEASKNFFNNAFTVLLRSTFDPYALDSVGTRISEFQWTEKKQLLRFESLTLNFPIVFTSEMFKKGGTGLASADSRAVQRGAGTEQEKRDVTDNPDDFIDFKIPWKLSVDYTFTLNARRLKTGVDTLITTQTLNFNGDVSLTPKWKIGFNSGYDFVNKAISRATISIYRDLHCWEMKFDIAPIGAYQHYLFTINVKSQILQDLKLIRRRYWRDF
jgi:hypothetical protein